MNVDARCFKRPDEFIPERWTTQPDLVKDGSAFAPFSMGECLKAPARIAQPLTATGKYSCVGRQLALMEIRFVLSQIVHRYNISFAPGQTPEAFLDGLVDGFTLMCPKLELVFTPRKA